MRLNPELNIIIYFPLDFWLTAKDSNKFEIRNSKSSPPAYHLYLIKNINNLFYDKKIS